MSNSFDGGEPTSAEMTDRPGRIERLMFRAVPLWSVLLLIPFGLVFLIGFGSLVKHRATGGERYGWLGDLVSAIADVPTTLRSGVGAPNAALPPAPRDALRDGLTRTRFVDPGYALIPRYAPERNRFIAKLIRLSDGAELHEWAPDIDAINRQSQLDTLLINLARDKGEERYPLNHALLTEDGGLIFHNYSPLVRVDACGRPVWTLDGIFHHSIEPDGEGNYWVPYVKAKSDRFQVSPMFRDDGIAKVSGEGKLLFTRNLISIFERAGLAGLWEG